MIRYFCLFNNEYEYGIVKSIHKFQYNAKEIIFVIMFRSRRCNYENIYSLLHTDTWVEQIALPISWLDSIVGMIIKTTKSSQLKTLQQKGISFACRSTVDRII